jgi:DNA-directed RNA polymerase subunit RPC12/RpoP
MQTKLRSASAVKCRKCAHLVPLATTDRLPQEFSVRCPNCGQRAFYVAGEIKISDADQATQREVASTGLRKAS